MRTLRPHTPTIHIPAERVPLILALSVGAWLGLYAVGFAVCELILMVGGVL